MLKLPGVIRSLLWPGLDTISTFIVGIAAVLVIARLIGDAAFGLGAVALSVVLVVLVMVNSLVHDAMICQEQLTDEDVDAAFTASLVVAVVASIALGLGAPLIGWYLGFPTVHRVIWAFMPLLILNGLSSPLVAERRRALKFGIVSKHQIVGRFLGAFVGLAAAWGGAGVWSYVALHCVTAAYMSGAMIVLAPRMPSLRISWQKVKPMLRFCRPIIFSQFIFHGFSRILVISMGYWHGLAAAGHWGIATRLSESIVGGATQAVYNVALAYLSRLQGSRERLAEALGKAQGLAMVAAVPALASLAAGSAPLISLLLDASWAPARNMLLGSLFGSFLLLRRMLPTTAVRAVGRSDVSTSASLADFALGGVALYILGPRSPIMIAVVAGLATVPGFVVTSHIADQELRVPVLSELNSFVRDLALGLTAITFGLGAGSLIVAHSALEELIVQGGVAFLAALCMMVLSNRKLLVSSRVFRAP
jgi:O-antigen/teichoic acid export membrane protein